jgi:hypothetical protein
MAEEVEGTASNEDCSKGVAQALLGSYPSRAARLVHACSPPPRLIDCLAS